MFPAKCAGLKQGRDLCEKKNTTKQTNKHQREDKSERERERERVKEIGTKWYPPFHV